MTEQPQAVGSPGKGADTSRRRVGLPRSVLILLGLAAALLILALVEPLQDFVAPVFLALNLVLTVSPLQSWLVRHRVNRWLAAVISGLLVLGIVALFFLAMAWSLVVLVQELPSYRAEFLAFYAQTIDWLQTMGITESQLAEQIQTIDPQSVVVLITGLLSNASWIVSILLVAITSVFFLMMDSVGFGRRMAIAAKSHPNVVGALGSFGAGVRRYWIVATIFGLIVAMLDWVVLIWVGVPLAAVWAVFAFLTNYIPNIGFVIGLIPPALMALLANGPTDALIIVALYSVLNFTVQSIIQPKFTGDAVGVTPTVTFVSLLVWAWVLGPLGALLALPATLLLKAIIVDADPTARWANALIASDPLTATTDPPKPRQNRPSPGRVRLEASDPPVSGPAHVDEPGHPFSRPTVSDQDSRQSDLDSDPEAPGHGRDRTD